MRKKIGPLLGSAMVLLLVGGLLWVFFMEVPLSEPQPLQFSVVMYASDNHDRWSALDQGIRQACLELEIESPVIRMASAEGQEALITQEIEAGTQGLLLAPADSADMAQWLSPQESSLPVVLLKSGFPGFDSVQADDAAMARVLAVRIRQMPGPVVLLDPPTQRSHLSIRKDAFLAALEESGKLVEVVEELSVLEELPGDSLVVALDTETLEKAIDARQDRPDTIRLYGIGSSNRVVHGLNQGQLQGVVFQNEYAIGYLATYELIAKIRPTPSPAEAVIQFMYVDRSTMYLPEAERLLFLLAQ